jgi:Flp pilus assembly protein TadB
MDHKEQHHEKHRHEREEKKKERKEHEHAEEKAGGSMPFHPAWFVVVGAVLVIAAIVIWTFFWN